MSRSISPRLRLERERTAIRPFAARDLEELLALRIANRAFLEPYESRRDERFYTADGQARELRLDREAWTTGQGYGFAVLDITGSVDRLIGRVALANVVLGSWRNATLGYWIDEASGSRGHATEAVLLTLRFAFDELGLHRVQPAVMPRNARSIRVVEKCGFRDEGLALRYLQINGAWEDHRIYAMTEEEWRARRR
ncbi:GNAT family N-acetyltransferase [Paraconexibacter sp.]|uniref:GNAT family N-acetyltransferase n=1 Tax=Paraconexibacter sp. TaxID=2949640 RepID=UPI003561518C